MLPEQVYTNLDDGVFYGESDGCYYYDSDGDGLPDTMLLDPAIINSDGPNPNPNPDPDPDDPDDEEDDDDDNDYGDEPPTGGGLTDEELMNLGRQAIGKMQTDISNGTFTYIFP